MYWWYRFGFSQNIVMAIVGLFIGAFEFFTYTLNRREYFKLLDELDDMRKPMMNTTMSMSTINSKGSYGAGRQAINFGPSANKYIPQRSLNSTMVSQAPPSVHSHANSNNINDLREINEDPSQMEDDGRYSFNNNHIRPNESTPSDRVLINNDYNQ
jgi:hypothetical protein